VVIGTWIVDNELFHEHFKPGVLAVNDVDTRLYVLHAAAHRFAALVATTAIRVAGGISV
jgi:hypothetical protein